jgi:hypothetical protein
MSGNKSSKRTARILDYTSCLHSSTGQLNAPVHAPLLGKLCGETAARTFEEVLLEKKLLGLFP